MAEEVEALWGDDIRGMVVAPHGTVASLKSLEWRSAAHPFPMRRVPRLLLLCCVR